MGLLTRLWSRTPSANDVVRDLASGPWLVRPGAVNAVIVKTMTHADALSKADIREHYAAFAAERKAFAADPGLRARRASESLDVRDGVAIIGLSGVMLKEKPSMADDCCSTVWARLQIGAALERSDVRSILLIIDTPGGEVGGTDALAEDIRQSSKPFHIHAPDLVASAGLWASVGADRFTVGKTAAVGSIGVYTVIHDTSKLFQEHGIEVDVISSGGVKGALADGVEITDEAKADVQRRISELADLFIGAVADGRGMPVADVRKLATGEVWRGDEAVRLGLADAVETDAQALEAARVAGSGASTTPRSIVAADPVATQPKPETKGPAMNLEEILAKAERGEALTADEVAFLRTNTAPQAAAPTPIEERADIPDDVRAELVASKEAHEKLAAEVAEMKKAKARAGFVAKAAGLAFVPGLSTDAMADQLEAAYAVSKEHGDQLMATFTATHNAVEQSKAFEAFGTERDGSASGPEAEMRAKADAIAKAKPDLTPQQAYMEACVSNPELAKKLD